MFCSCSTSRRRLSQPSTTPSATAKARETWQAPQASPQRPSSTRCCSTRVAGQSKPEAFSSLFRWFRPPTPSHITSLHSFTELNFFFIQGFPTAILNLRKFHKLSLYQSLSLSLTSHVKLFLALTLSLFSSTYLSDLSQRLACLRKWHSLHWVAGGVAPRALYRRPGGGGGPQGAARTLAQVSPQL